MKEPCLPVSFIVPVYNAEETVIETLQSILDLHTPCSIELIIVDDGSTDASVDRIEAWKKSALPNEQIIRNVLLKIPHGGEAAAMNAGLKQATSPVVGWVESDVKLDRNWLTQLLPELAKDRVMGAGGLLLPAESDSAVARMFGYEIAYKIRSNTADALHITSANALYRKEIFDQLGPCRLELGESSFDSEFNQRIRDAGYRLRCNSQAIAWHHFKTRLGECLKRTGWYGFRRPFVSSQVLYPFDRILALLVLLAGMTIPALLLVWMIPFIAIPAIGVGILSQILYSLFLYSRFRDRVLLGSFPVFWMRNVIFLMAYGCGMVYKWSRTLVKRG